MTPAPAKGPMRDRRHCFDDHPAFHVLGHTDDGNRWAAQRCASGRRRASNCESPERSDAVRDVCGVRPTLYLGAISLHRSHRIRAPRTGHQPPAIAGGNPRLPYGSKSREPRGNRQAHGRPSPQVGLPRSLRRGKRRPPTRPRSNRTDHRLRCSKRGLHSKLPRAYKAKRGGFVMNLPFGRVCRLYRAQGAG